MTQPHHTGRAFSLDATLIGDIILKVPTASALAAHERPADTLRDYVKPNTQELEFVRDLFTLRTDEMADKWYGGAFEASCAATTLLSIALKPGAAG